MKNKILIILSLIVFLISCSPLLDSQEEVFTGITFNINNNTDVTYTDANITIGGMKDGSFIGTETYNFPSLTITGTNEWDTYYGNGVEGNPLRIASTTFDGDGKPRWKPNLDLIRNLPSEKAYFKLTLTVGNETLLQNVNEDGVLTTLVSRAIPKGYEFKYEDGVMYIGIWEEGVIAKLYEN